MSHIGLFDCKGQPIHLLLRYRRRLSAIKLLNFLEFLGQKLEYSALQRILLWYKEDFFLAQAIEHKSLQGS